MDQHANRKTISVVHLDDDIFVLEKIEQALASASFADVEFRVESFSETQAFIERIASLPRPDVAILDIQIADSETDGKMMARHVRARLPQAVILMCSSYSDVRTVSECLRIGADDFISKTSENDELSLRVYNAYRLCRLRHGSPDSTSTPSPVANAALAGATLRSISKRIPLIIDSAVSAVHVFGESGTGKEVVADLFRTALPSGKPFIKVNCGAIAPTLLESELFGHVKGAFTGATSDKRGLIESADGGWIFLDEIATLSSSAQVALLRVLDSHTVRRVGSTDERQVSIRIVSATNEPLPELVKAGRFRQDLWQRLCEAQIDLPPLRERTGEIEELVRHFCNTMAGGPYTIAPTALSMLRSYHWSSGNVRELRNCLRAMTELSVDKMLTPQSIPERIVQEIDDAAHVATIHPLATARDIVPFDDNTIAIHWQGDAMPGFETLTEMLLVRVVMREYRAHGRMSLRTLAKQIGIPRSTLSTKIKDLATKGHLSAEELHEMIGASETKAAS